MRAFILAATLILVSPLAHAQTESRDAMRSLMDASTVEAEAIEMTPIMPTIVGTYLGNDTSVSYEFEAGVDYFIVLHTLPGSGLDPDLYVNTPSEENAYISMEPGGSEIVGFQATETGRHDFDIRISGCESGATCIYGIGVYR
ncbi:MAG: hypothetical protein AAGK21_06210 [Bacteroidota bacterium]